MSCSDTLVVLLHQHNGLNEVGKSERCETMGTRYSFGPSCRDKILEEGIKEKRT